MWDYLVKKIRPSRAPLKTASPQPTRGPVKAETPRTVEQRPAVDEYQSRDRHLACPVCSGAMRMELVGGVEIDRCSSCGGIFLDQGELEELRHAPGSKVAPTVSPDQRGSVLVYTPNGLRRD